MSWSTLKFRTTRNLFPQLTHDVAWKRQRSVFPHPGCIHLHRVKHASNAIDLAYVRNIQSSWSCTGEKIIELLVWLCGKYRSTNNNLDGLLISNILHSIFCLQNNGRESDHALQRIILTLRWPVWLMSVRTADSSNAGKSDSNAHSF